MACEREELALAAVLPDVRMFIPSKRQRLKSVDEEVGELTLNDLQDIFDTRHRLFLSIADLNETLMIFQHSQTLLVVHQIEHFATIDLVEGDKDVDGRRGRQTTEQISRGLNVDSRGRVVISTHGECLAGSCLSVGEDRGIAPLKDRLDQWRRRVTIDQLRGDAFIEGIIEFEVLMFEIFGQIDFRLGNMNDALISRGNRHDIVFFLRQFTFIHRSFPHSDTDSQIFRFELPLMNVRIAQRGEV